MADRSKIEWTDSTWNPIRARRRDNGHVGFHCEHVSEACRNCYAEGMNKRLFTGLDYKPGNRDQVEIFLDEKTLLQPLRGKRPRKIFVCSMTDLFADFVADEMIDRIFAVMALCPQHTFQILTKRPERMRKYIAGEQFKVPILGGKPLERVHFAAAVDEDHCDYPFWEKLGEYGNLYSLYCSVPWPLPNVWLGVTAENQKAADERIPDLLATPAAVRWVSYEPALGPLDIRRWSGEAIGGSSFRADGEEFRRCDLTGNPLEGIDWVVTGGETGPYSRFMNPEWPRAIAAQCASAGTAYFHKHNGEWLDADTLGAPYKRLNKPLTFSEAENLAELGDFRFEHLSAGSTLIRCGKKRAGRLLDGREHNAFPEVTR
jgi:protein gp37